MLSCLGLRVGYVKSSCSMGVCCTIPLPARRLWTGSPVRRQLSLSVSWRQLAWPLPLPYAPPDRRRAGRLTRRETSWASQSLHFPVPGRAKSCFARMGVPYASRRERAGRVPRAGRPSAMEGERTVVKGTPDLLREIGRAHV